MNPNIDDGSHTDLFGSMTGAVTGCTRLQELGRPEALSAAAARGCAGQMIVGTQSGGYGYGMGDGASSGLLASPKASYANMTKYANIGLNSDLSRGAYNQNTAMKTGGRRRTGKKGRKQIKHSRKTKKYHKGTKSVSRPGHKDFMTNKKSKMYNEKRLKKLIGRKTVRAPVFSFAGGKRKSFRKGSKSLSRPGHKDFMTNKKSKMYNEKRLKKLIGRKTVRAPVFSFAGGAMMPKVSSPNDLTKTAKLGSESSVGYQLMSNQPCDLKSGTHNCGVGTIGPQLTGGSTTDQIFREDPISKDSQHYGNLVYGGKRKEPKSHRRNMRGGYCQFMNNVPLSFGQSFGGVKLSSGESALASPAPYVPYSNCKN